MQTNSSNPEKQESTSGLLSGIFQTSSLSNFLAEHEASLQLPTLSEYLNALCQTKGVERFEVVKRAGIERSFGFQIFQGTKSPSRDKVIQLAIGFGMGLEEAQALIKLSQKSALYPRVKRDAAIIYCLNRHLDFTDTQAVLAGMKLAILGSERD